MPKYQLWRGIEGVVTAEVLKDTVDEYVTGEVFDLIGASELSKTTESSSETKYFDNMPAIVVRGTGPDEVGITGTAIPFNVLAKITGQYYDETLGMFIEGDATPKYYALGYKTKRQDGTLVYVWRYKGTYGIPDVTHITEDDGTDANGQELTYTGVSTTHVFKSIGMRAKALNLELAETSVDVSTFFDKVTTPDMLRNPSSASTVGYVDENGNKGVVTSDVGAVNYEYI